VVLLLVLAACGMSSTSSSTDLNIFAAASLTAALSDAGEALEAANADLAIENTFMGSQALVTQIQDGAPVDVFASADEENMQKLVADDLVDTPQVFAKNRLQIAVASGNPKHIKTLADTLNDGVNLVLADESVPAGNYARHSYEKAGLPEPEPVSNELDVRAVMAKLISGEADAVVVYGTDVTAAGDAVEGIEIPDEHEVIASYPIAVLKASKNQVAAQAYVDAIVSGAGQTALREKGFLPPE
jgi:molybdate transport system substrate-binding protein